VTGRGVLVYGSLLDPAELEATLSPATVERAFPVEVHGYRRSFNKVSAHREGEHGEQAICNTEPDPDAWLNAVLVPDVPADEYELYREREYRYEMVNVPATDLVAYDGEKETTVAALDERLIATSEGGLDDPEPIPYYVAMCVDGARSWGEKFLADFVVTTERV
jgi:cation transport regulator ChaC